MVNIKDENDREVLFEARDTEKLVDVYGGRMTMTARQWQDQQAR